MILVLSHLIERVPGQRGVLLRLPAGLTFGISDGAIKTLSGGPRQRPIGLLSPWTTVIVTAAVFSCYASARSLQIGDGVAVIAVPSVGANLSTILAGKATRTCRPSSFDSVLIEVRMIGSQLREKRALAHGQRRGARGRHGRRSYGVFGLVLSLIAWIYLLALVTVFAAEISVVAERRLWPRALLTPFTDRVRITAADERPYPEYAGQRAPQTIRGHRRRVRPTAREHGEASVRGLVPWALWSSTRAERMLADVRSSVRLRHTPGITAPKREYCRWSS
jgi:hypothetical protein